MNENCYQIRNAKLEDVPSIVELSHQLGYPSSKTETKKCLELILNSEDQAAFVAHTEKNEVTGWIHVCKRLSLESGFFAEIGGFIISESFRGKGIGKRLLVSAEQWTLQKNLPKLRVRSQVHREEARHFYLTMGFVVSKQQRIFDKKIKRGV